MKEAVQSPVSSVDQNNVKLRKDFKLSGQIYGKKVISYTSLIRQIEAGIKKKRHSKDDLLIAFSVVCSRSPVYEVT